MRVCMDCKLSLHVNLVYKELRAAGENSGNKANLKAVQVADEMTKDLLDIVG